MPTIVTCHNCGARAKAPDAAAGKTLACPKCKTPVSVPQPNSGTFSPPDPQGKPHPSHPKTASPPFNVTVVNQADDLPQGRPESTTRKGFGWGFGLTIGIIAALLVIPAVSMLVCCGFGGFLGLGVVGSSAVQSPQAAERRREEPVAAAPQQIQGEQPAPVHRPTAEPDKAKAEPAKTKADKTRVDDDRRDASVGPVRLGDVEVGVDTVRYQIPAMYLKNSPTRDYRSSKMSPMLTVWLTVKNVSDSRILRYQTWSAQVVLNRYSRRPHSAHLSDDSGNQYSLFPFFESNGAQFRGQVDFQTFHPGETVKDMIAFERPLRSAMYFNLDLPMAAITKQMGVLKLRIPATMIDWGEPAKTEPQALPDTQAKAPPEPPKPEKHKGKAAKATGKRIEKTVEKQAEKKPTEIAAHTTVKAWDLGRELAGQRVKLTGPGNVKPDTYNRVLVRLHDPDKPTRILARVRVEKGEVGPIKRDTLDPDIGNYYDLTIEAEVIGVAGAELTLKDAKILKAEEAAKP